VIVNVNELTETSKDDQSKPTEASRKVVIRGRSTSSQHRPKWNAGRPDNKDAAPLLAVYASVKTSRSALYLPPVPYLKKKNHQSPGQVSKEKEKLWKAIREIHTPSPTPLLAREVMMIPTPNMMVCARCSPYPMIWARHSPHPDDLGKIGDKKPVIIGKMGGTDEARPKRDDLFKGVVKGPMRSSPNPTRWARHSLNPMIWT
jgi:hypothetical protein